MIPVHILVTCRKPELLAASKLVFDTLHTGFPNSDVTVHLNLPLKCEDEIFKACEKACVNRVLTTSDMNIHHKWIEDLYAKADGPFWILDTDVAFWDEMESVGEAALEQNVALAGRYIPMFYDDFTKCVTMPRLHTSLLLINKPRIEEVLKEIRAEYPNTPFNPLANLFYPQWLPMHSGPPIFFDTCSLLHQLLGMKPCLGIFTEEELNRYDHVQFATICDLIAPYYPGEQFLEKHFAVFANPDKFLRGAWREQDEFYRRRSQIPDRPHFLSEPVR